MKKSKLLIIIALFFIVNIYSQEYNFINKVVKYSKKDTIYLMENFLNNFRVEINSFNEYNFKEWWEPIPSSNIPPIESFLDNFNLTYLRADFLENIKNDSIIDFNLLDKRFIRIVENDLKKDSAKLKVQGDYSKYLNSVYLSISKPVFNCSKDWAVIIISSNSPYLHVGEGYLNIYRKDDDKWILYHRLELWTS